MNEIKLRAWDCFNAVFYYSDKYKKLYDFFRECEECAEHGNEIIYQLYTGISDLGYAGDIVINENGMVRVVVWDADGRWALKRPDGSLHDRGCGKWRVIGNIYENPELLNQKGE